MIAKVLKEYRKRNDYSVRDVAKLLEERSLCVAEKTIYGWESGQTQPDADTLLILCDIYNIDDILSTFGYTRGEPFQITTFERDLILNYRMHPQMHAAVKKLLDLESDHS